MTTSAIVIRGAREHNLRDVSVDLPRNRLICLTGVSGSGKSSLAFDTLYAEGQRRYVESLSSFARQFLGQMPKPDVDLVDGLSPSISISQKSSGTNPRSTVGTITEISDYLRVLYARIGQGHCPDCDVPIAAQTLDQIVAILCQRNTAGRITILAPLIRGQKGQHRDLLEDLRKQGFVRARINGEIMSLAALPDLERQRRHDIEVVIDRLEIQTAARARVADAVELAAKLGKGNLMVVAEDSPAASSAAAAEQPEPADADEAEQDDRPRRGKGSRRNPAVEMYSTQYACPQCGQSFEPPSPQLFSFNSPRGMCLECDGLGEIFTFDPQRLMAAPHLSLHDGCCELLGKWKDLGRWRRHIFQGVADTLERVRGLPADTLLHTPWAALDPACQRLWLWGTGGQHITFTWRGGSTPMKYGGQFEGIIPELIARYRGLKSAAKRRQLEQYMATVACGACNGQRLNRQASSVRLTSRHPRFPGGQAMSLPAVGELSIRAAQDFFAELELSPTQHLIAADALKEIQARLGFLLNVGLDYLTLNRTAPTLSGGESQRIRLASQIGSGLVGVLYVLDEPSIGLHARDNDRLIATLKHLRDLGNTVVVVEHDEETIRASDWVIDFGPGPGVRGGEIVAQGPPAAVASQAASRTGRFLAGIDTIEPPAERRTLDPQRSLRIVGARQNNLKNIDVRIPLGGLICVTGVSGSGKSSLVNDILMESLREDLNRGIAARAAYERIEGLEHLDKLIAIDQSPIGRTPRSNPGTYIKLFDEIRNLYAKLPESKRRGFKSGRFSFNVGSGRCQACEGNGANKLEMDFLADLWITCPVCQGQRFNRETLQVKFNGKSIADVLELEVAAALPFFENVPKIYDKLKTLHAVGLDYLRIGQPSPTLSGGEAQRIKLAREFVKRSTGRTLYVMDEPTTGLHFADIKLLLEVLQQFVAGGNTVLVVEHNLDVIKTADWIIDIGPEGGEGGGTVVCEGPPERIAACAASYTGRALRRILHPAPRKPAEASGRRRRGEPAAAPAAALETISVRGASQHSLRAVDVDLPRDKMTVFCGPSGSGKSSLAMDTIYAEGQRRYVESLSSYARQFVNQMQKPRVEHVTGLSPAIAIEQKNLGNTPRSTVGTVTEVYDFFRVLFARLGVPHCPVCNVPVGTQTADQIVDKILEYAPDSRLYLLAPLDLQSAGSGGELLEDLRAQGFQRVRINRQTYGVDEAPLLDRRQRLNVEVVVDRVVVRADARVRIADSVETALALGKGNMLVAVADEQRPESDWPVHRHSQHLACSQCGLSLERLAPHHFSFNSPIGWCPECEGLGQKLGADPRIMLTSLESTLAEGALALWPDPQQPVSRAMLEALGRTYGIPLDRPFNQLDAAQRRVLFYGGGPRSIAVPPTAGLPGFSFQFQGLFNAMENVARLVPGLRSRLSLLVTEVDCGLCFGSRLRADAAAVRLRDWTMDALGRLPLARLAVEVNGWQFDARERKIAGEILREIGQRVQFLVDVGLDYLTLGRGANTLSNGEAQRIRLASQLGSGLCGVLYVLDEPTVGLHPRDNRRLLGALHRLRDLGNTLIVVEHDREVIAESDEICDFGPGAGTQGGTIVAQGPPGKLPRIRGSVTGPYLSGAKAISVPAQRRPVLATAAANQPAAKPSRSRKTRSAPAAVHPAPLIGAAHATAEYAVECLRVLGAQQHNLKNIDVAIPLGVLTAVTGPSGCGKSSLINDIVYHAIARRLHRATAVPGAHRKLEGLANINKVIQVDQSPLGNSPSSNPATYTGAFDLIRELFAHLPDARVRGYSARRFSFNVPGGRCEACEGNGQMRIEMHFLPDVWVQCEVCRGRRYNEETLAVQFQGHSIHDVLEMNAAAAASLFRNVPKIQRIVQTLCDVGLDYVRLGQSAPTLSGGEAQRVKLAAELSRPDTGRTLYLLDEPTTGLHFDDLAKLLEVLHRLVDLGNSVVVIEHNLDLIKHADWVLDLGPEAGAGGGTLVVAGTPEMVADYAAIAAGDPRLPPSHTGTFLREVLERDPRGPRRTNTPTAVAAENLIDDFRELGQNAAMPWQVDGRLWHTQTRVGRDGQPARWDGELLARVVDFIHNHGEFAETNWGERSIVEISGRTKSQGWFLHALTGESWLLKLKFRVRRNTFRAETLRAQIPLKTLNELDEVPRYSNASRIQVSALPGGWQEIEIQAYALAELDQPAFWQFVEDAIASYQEKQQRVELNLDEQMPWAKLGKRWHLLPKGFGGSKRPAWDLATLEALFDLLAKLEPSGSFTWNNKQVVHFFAPQQQGPWLSVQTKKLDAIWLQLNGPAGALGLGAVTEHFPQATLSQAAEAVETIRIPLKTLREVRGQHLKALLKQHLARLQRS